MFRDIARLRSHRLDLPQVWRPFCSAVARTFAAGAAALAFGETRDIGEP
jgi:hypothetical protein